MKWEGVLKFALAVLERQKDHIPFTEWTWGGGSALSCRYRHRDSEDVDMPARGDARLMFAERLAVDKRAVF